MSRSIATAGAPGRLSALFPAFTILVGTLLLALPLPVERGGLPLFPLLLLIAWAGVQPRLVPAPAAFLLGLFADAVAGLPLGVMAASFVAVRVMAGRVSARAAGRSLAEEWLAAAAFLMAAALVQMAALALADRGVAAGPLLVQAALSILGYPAAFALVARLNGRLADKPGLAS